MLRPATADEKSQFDGDLAVLCDECGHRVDIMTHAWAELMARLGFNPGEKHTCWRCREHKNNVISVVLSDEKPLRETYPA